MLSLDLARVAVTSLTANWISIKCLRKLVYVVSFWHYRLQSTTSLIEVDTSLVDKMLVVQEVSPGFLE